MPKTTQETPAIDAAAAGLALPPKRARRRTTRASHSWRFRQPPSRKRVEISCARALPEAIAVPVQNLPPRGDSCH